MEADLPFNLLFNRAVCLAFFPRPLYVLRNRTRLQKNMVVLPMTAMPHDGVPSDFTGGKLEGAQQVDERREPWESRNPFQDSLARPALRVVVYLVSLTRTSVHISHLSLFLSPIPLFLSEEEVKIDVRRTRRCLKYPSDHSGGASPCRLGTSGILSHRWLMTSSLKVSGLLGVRLLL